jgi:hypothetical protein
MKKQIAFRIYDRISKTIEYPEILEQDNYGTYGENGIHSCEHPRFKRELGVTMFDGEEGVFMLRSDYEDLKGVEIYEDDIVILGTGDKAKVVYEKSCFMIKPEHELPNCPIYLHELFDKKITVEVIGNIFINPDMDIK